MWFCLSPTSLRRSSPVHQPTLLAVSLCVTMSMSPRCHKPEKDVGIFFFFLRNETKPSSARAPSFIWQSSWVVIMLERHSKFTFMVTEQISPLIVSELELLCPSSLCYMAGDGRTWSWYKQAASPWPSLPAHHHHIATIPPSRSSASLTFPKPTTPLR